MKLSYEEFVALPIGTQIVLEDRYGKVIFKKFRPNVWKAGPMEFFQNEKFADCLDLIALRSPLEVMAEALEMK